MIRGIEHTAIASPDPASLAQWYVDTLDFVINYRGTTAFFVKAANGSMIEIIQAEGEGTPHGMATPGLRHLAILVENFEPVYARLVQKKVRFLTEPAEKGGNKVVFFTDPEGNILHLLERRVPLP
jgi:glyoxylase I family protein